MLTIANRKAADLRVRAQASAAFGEAEGSRTWSSFPRSEQGLAGFRKFLAPHPARARLRCSSTTVRGGLSVETLPHCFGAERKQMVARKLKQHYRNTPYVGRVAAGP